MAECVAANMIIGGCVPTERFAAFAARIAAENLHAEWHGDRFDARIRHYVAEDEFDIPAFAAQTGNS